MRPLRAALLAAAFGFTATAAPGCISQKRVDRAEARVDLGAAYMREDNAAGAIPVLEEATKLDPRSWNAWNKLALAYLAQGALDLSEDAFNKALKLNSSAEVRNNYGFLLMRKGDLVGATQQFEQALTDITYRKPALVLSNLGHVLYLQGRYEEAVARLGAAIDRAPNMCQPRFNRGLAQAALGDRKRALDDFEAVINLCGEDASGAYLQAARILMDQGDRTGACTYLRIVMDDAKRSQLGDEASDLHARVCL